MNNSRDKAPYAKPKNRSSKIIGGGGPRDMQRRQQNSGVLSTPKFDITDLVEIKSLLSEKLDIIETGSSGGIPPEEVERQITAAIESTRQEESDRYESGLKSINEQLNAAKIKIALMEKELENSIDSEAIESLKHKIRSKDAEIKVRDKRIKELEDKLKSGESPIEVDTIISRYEEEISKLKDELKVIPDLRNNINEKIKLINELETTIIERNAELTAANVLVEQLKVKSEKSNEDFSEMKLTMELMFEKLSNLQLVAGENNNSGVPSIDDNKVFINPTEDKPELQSHIDIEATSTVGNSRNVKSDLNKLRALVRKGNYTPSKAKSDLID